jgi:hypothetical protein
LEKGQDSQGFENSKGSGGWFERVSSELSSIEATLPNISSNSV